MGASAANINYRVALGRSRLAAALVIAAGAATLALLAAIPADPVTKVVAVVWIGATWLDAYRRAGAAREFVLRGDEIDVASGDGTWCAGRLRAGSFVAPWLTIVRWRPQRARLDRTIVILPGMLARERFRELRVLLRWN